MDTERASAVTRFSTSSPEWAAESEGVRRAMRVTAELNRHSLDDAVRVRELFSELTGQHVDETFSLFPPVYTSGGNRIRVGHKVFINQCCTI